MYDQSQTHQKKANDEKNTHQNSNRFLRFEMDQLHRIKWSTI